MKDKEKILQAIETYDTYNKSTKLVLKTLVAVATHDNIVNISIKALADLSQVSRQGVYNALRYIERDRVATRFKSSCDGTTVFTLNLDSIANIVEYHENLQLARQILK